MAEEQKMTQFDANGLINSCQAEMENNMYRHIESVFKTIQMQRNMSRKKMMEKLDKLCKQYSIKPNDILRFKTEMNLLSELETDKINECKKQLNAISTLLKHHANNNSIELNQIAAINNDEVD